MDLLNLNEFLKHQGFKKRGTTWSKKVGENTVFIKVRKSSFSDETLIDLGVFFPVTEIKPDINECQLVSSVSRLNKKSITKEDLEKFNNSISTIFTDVILPELYNISDIKYLKQSFPNNFDHDKWWLAKIRELDFINFLNN